MPVKLLLIFPELSLNNINMKKVISPVLGFTAIVAASLIILQISCGSQPEETKPEAQLEKKELSNEDLIARGKYLTTVAGCNDCHTPKIFGPQGPRLDTTRILSGHPAADPLPPIDVKALQPGHWVLFASDLTSAVGPWGISYAANLTPDSATGIGAWDETVFVKALRTGKHLGGDNARPILPPMHWQTIGMMSDEDLKSIYTYLRTIQAINNRVPTNVPPNEVLSRPK
jgi:hypothetical protein